MSGVTLSKRLQAIYSLIEEDCNTVADIGTDHGKLICALLLENRCRKAIACDISKGSLDKAIRLANKLGFREKFEARLGNGLKVLNHNEVDIILLCGMGGMNIISILEESKDIAFGSDSIIIQPMRNTKDVRCFLLNNGFLIQDEELVYEDGRYYNIIKTKQGLPEKADYDYADIGKALINKRHPLLKDYLVFCLNKAKAIEKRLKNTSGCRANELKQEIAVMEGVLNDMYN